jgi:quinol monooxygenase YgiN
MRPKQWPSGIENSVQRQHINSHGKYDINFGDFANGKFTAQSAILATRELTHSKEKPMPTVGLFARLEAKPGKEKDVAKFLETGLSLANQETTTPIWFALRLGPSTFGIFDAFKDESGRQAHLNGPIAKALMAKASELLSKPPVIEQIEVLGAKLPK